MNRVLAKKNVEIQMLYSQLQTNLEFARIIQRAMMPPSLHLLNGLWVTAYSEALHGVSGDLYDIVPLKGGTVLYVADVSGHGVPAALLCSAFKALFRFTLALKRDLVTSVNLLAKSMRTVLGSSYVTALFAHVKSKTVEFLNCGHPPPLVFFGKFPARLELPARNPIGLESRPYLAGDVFQVSYKHGQPFLMFTDGVYSGFEGRNSGNRVSYDEFVEFLDEVRRTDCQLFVPETLTMYLPQKFRQLGRSFRDDVTLLAFGKPRLNSGYLFFGSDSVNFHNGDSELRRIARAIRRRRNLFLGESQRGLVVKKGPHLFVMLQEISPETFLQELGFGKTELKYSSDEMALLIIRLGDSPQTQRPRERAGSFENS